MKFIFAFVVLSPAILHAGLVLVAGSGSHGDGGTALSALLDGPAGLAEDSDGNIYISEANAGVIRRVSPDGVISRFAGTGRRTEGTAGRSALDTDLISPGALAVNVDHELLFADNGSCRIRKVRADGTIEDLVGSGRCAGTATAGPGGFGGGSGGNVTRERRATELDLSGVSAITTDSVGRIVFSEESQHIVRRLDNDGYVRVIAGSGFAAYAGDDGAATAAYLQNPRGIAYDPSGRLYIADALNCRIRRVDTQGNITTVAGSGTCATTTSFTSGTASKVNLGRLVGMSWDPASATIVFSSLSQSRVGRYDPDQERISLVAGTGKTGPVITDVPTALNLHEPAVVLATQYQGVLVVSAPAAQVYRIQEGAVARFAGDWPQRDVYPDDPLKVSFLRPVSFCLKPDGSLVVADAGTEQILLISPTGFTSRLAGAVYPLGYTAGDEGPATESRLGGLNRVACASDGSVYLTTSSSQIRKIDADGLLIHLVRNGISQPAGIAFDSQGRLLYSEAGSHRVMRWDPADRSTTRVAGNDKAGFSGDGSTATDAQLNTPGDLAVDAQDNVYIADRLNRRVRLVTPGGIISTVAGSSREFSYVDITGGIATDTGFSKNLTVAVDSATNVYIGEYNRLSGVVPSGRMRLLAGYAGETDDGTQFWKVSPLNGVDAMTPDTAGGRLLFSSIEQGRLFAIVQDREEQ